MDVHERKLNDLIPYEFNNRNHSPKQIALIAKSIKEFGFNQPIVIDENSIILIGHGRLLAAQELGLKKVPTVQILGLSEQQKKAYRILDNKLQNDSTWSFDNLMLELENLKDSDFDIEAWGLDELEDLAAKYQEPASITEDAGPGELPKETYIKLGDLIELGPHRVFCGDSCIAETVSLVTENHVDLCFTSPPYNAGDNSLGGNKFRRESKYINQTDDRSQEDYENLLFTFTEVSLSICRVVAVNLQLLAGNKWSIPRYWAKFGNRLIDQAIWYKGHGQPQQAAHVLNSRFEYIFFFSGDREYPSRSIPFANFHGTESNVYDASSASGGNRESKIHAATFPLHLPGWAMRLMPQAKTIYDPFLGTGTTLIAADQLGRVCYGMEIEPKYCQVIIERYQKHCEATGKPFVCKINGKPFDLPVAA